ncbi:response regulator transcription factor [Thiothrix lacustris]|uniref:Response regulator transcription factor n=1 Tax=Thiothrix lacustris TaxID=525917 RepID=A0ABY9MLE1_9GAMM|nr:response regulator transcription factor [Thiothrix lacustris]WML89485.1 response regulator transcription factor [Thiothrix lacustris]
MSSIHAPHLYRVVLIDDDILLHKLLEMYLFEHHYQLQSLSCGEEIRDFISQQTPDLILLDIMLPGKDGLHWLNWLKHNYPNIPVMLLSAKKSAEERLIGLEFGADDYLTKPFHPKELLIRIRKIMRHPTLANKHVTYQIGSNLFNPAHEHLERNNQLIKLTTQESSLLQFFCQRPDEILTRDCISQALNGNEHQPLNRSIDMTINRLRKKLGDHASNPRYLCTVWRKGYRLTLAP